MNKKGFTLVELLAVIVLIALVSILAFSGVGAVSKAIKKSIWENKIELIENGAIRYGEDNMYDLTHPFIVDGKQEDITCDGYIAGISHDVEICKKRSVDELLKRNYIATNERDENDEKIIINDVTDEIVNDTYVYIWVENDVVYAHYAG